MYADVEQQWFLERREGRRSTDDVHRLLVELLIPGRLLQLHLPAEPPVGLHEHGDDRLPLQELQRELLGELQRPGDAPAYLLVLVRVLTLHRALPDVDASRGRVGPARERRG